MSVTAAASREGKFRYGLKLWSTNENYLPEARRLLQNGGCDYLELFCVPGTFEERAAGWAALGAPYVIHAPHFVAGLNFSRKDQFDQNMRYAGEALRYADLLQSDTVIFHPGIEGELAETVRQLGRLKGDPRVVIENKPHLGINDVVCVGSKPEEIALVLRETGVGFCLDVGHAICAANSHGEEPMGFLERFLALNPRICHLTDGWIGGQYDDHLHIGAGDYDLPAILALLPAGRITVETEKDSRESLADFERDIAALRGIEAKLHEGAQ